MRIAALILRCPLNRGKTNEVNAVIEAAVTRMTAFRVQSGRNLEPRLYGTLKNFAGRFIEPSDDKGGVWGWRMSKFNRSHRRAVAHPHNPAPCYAFRNHTRP